MKIKKPFINLQKNIMEQQQPREISAQELFDNAFKGVEEKKEETPINELPTPPVNKEEEEVKTEVPTNDVLQQEIDTPLEGKQKTNFQKRINNLISDGFLEDVSINIDGEDVFLSEAEIQDEETYKTILESIKEEKDKKLKENYISKEGLDDITQKLIEVKKAGGDITEIIKKDVKAIDQLTNLRNTLDSVEIEESDKEKLQINIISQDLHYRGLSPKVIQAQIQDYVENGALSNEADKILNAHLELYNNEIEKKRQQELDRLNKEKEDLKLFKKDLSSKYKSWNLPDNIYKTLLDNATKLDQDSISNTDKLYFEAQKNPELFAKVNFLLNNPNEFEKWVGSKKAVEAKKEIIKSSIVINTNKINDKKSKRSKDSLGDLADDVFNK